MPSDDLRRLHLVANCLIFHNVYEMTKALHRLLSEGVLVKEETIQHLSPYITEHINRFGVYEWNPERAAPPLNYDIEILSPQSVAGVCLAGGQKSTVFHDSY